MSKQLCRSYNTYQVELVDMNNDLGGGDEGETYRDLGLTIGRMVDMERVGGRKRSSLEVN